MLLRYAIITLTMVAIVPSALASTYVDVGDDIYYTLSRLEAEGIIKSGALTTKPLSRKEITRLLQEAEGYSGRKSEVVQPLIDTLKERFRDDLDDKKFVKPADNIYGKFSYSDSGIPVLDYNKDGDRLKKGANVRLGFASRAEFDWLALYLNPEFRYSDDTTKFIALKAYGVLHALGLDLIVGKDSQWWGPGYHGSLLLSNNPEPLKMVKLTNPQPVLLPWVFEYLGPVQFAFFISQLEDNPGKLPGSDRVPVSEPYLWGMRLTLKPHPFLELGLGRTALLGGKGRRTGLKTWLRSFTGAGENDPSESGDQRAGYDVKLTLPFPWQPVQMYMEAAGEDEAGGLPSKWAYLTGMYLPRVAGLERVDLRAEFATNHISGDPNVWYAHHIFGQGYTYKGRIIGHHMGTDSRDVFVEASYLIPERSGRISLFYDREEHNLSGSVREKKDEFGLNAGIRLTKEIELKASYGHGRVKNLGNIAGDDKEINRITSEITCRF